MCNKKQTIVIDHNAPLDIYGHGGSQMLTFAERMAVYRCLLFEKGFACSRYRGIRGILRLSVQFFKNESRSLFRRSQQHVTANERTSPEFERWARAMEGLQDLPQCGQGSEGAADKRAVIVIDERFTWPWNVYYNEGGKRKRLPLRLYPSTLWFYVRLVPGKLSRSVRNSLHGLTRFGKSRRHAPSNTRSSRKDGPPSDNPCREAEQS